jgi:beta-fructofuranosidase
MKRRCASLLLLMVIPLWVSTVLAQEKRKDYTSKVPQSTYSETLEKQLDELKSDPQMLRFAQSRAELSSDKHRPLFHFTSPEGRLNDPNGLCYWQGNWHMFYQGYPPDDPRQHWGHAISKDLIHWNDLPYAIYPNPERKCYSGTALVEDDRVIVMYQGVDAGEMVAISDDPLLLNWDKLTGGPVIPTPKEDEPQFPFKLWDPCIWSNDGVYYSLIGAWQDTGPGNKLMRADYLLRSENLTDWEYLHPFVEEDDFSLVGDDGACPYFWPIGDYGKYILLHFSHMSGGKYMVGDYDTKRNKFVVTNGAHFNHGPVNPGGLHAPSAFPDGEGGINCIFNMNPGIRIKDAKWNQLMTMPVNLTIDEEDYIHIRPTGDYASLRKEHQQITNMNLPVNEEIVLENIHGNAMEIKAIIDTKNSDYVELNVLRSPDKEEFTRIVFYRNRGYSRNYDPMNQFQSTSAIMLDNSNASILPGTFSRLPESADVLMGEDELAELHIFIDRSVVEVFVNGRQLVAARVYPGLDESVGVSIKARGSDAILKSLDAWQMDNIYD